MHYSCLLVNIHTGNDVILTLLPNVWRFGDSGTVRKCHGLLTYYRRQNLKREQSSVEYGDNKRCLVDGKLDVLNGVIKDQWRIRRILLWGQHGPKAVLLRPEGPKAGKRFLGMGSQPPPHQLGGLGSAVSSSSGVRDGAPAAKRFCL